MNLKAATLWEWMKSIAIALLLAFLVQKFIVEFFVVSGPSMNHTLANNERLLVNKIPYYFHNPQRGDIIIFQENPTEAWVKRVIGLPGDKIKIDHGQLYINGVKVDEPYINNPMSPTYDFPAATPTGKSSSQASITVPPGELFVMGDNRDVSVDSRVIGPIKISQVIGQAEAVVYPFDQIKWLSRPDSLAHLS
ncbi:signal peptidase I [Collibacillus ludicampi]|jgi:signal peptidase I|uniref:Signal peptidase I n=1 Tax=Collibacillus ludicampi TaxID=2771369 RepID=A0AAV4LDH8_9BACL|nr:signal peptidase I [Collibacillus ludicampi]GIM45907.1 signal peptidase I [Collibacillus ludicampi]